MIFFLMEYFRAFVKHFKEQKIQQIIYSTLLIIFFGSGVFYWLESGVNEGIHHYGDALWWILVTMTTVGYGDLYPVTTGGRIIAVFVMLAGIGLLTVIIGVFASAIQTINLRKEMGKLITSFKDHIIICGWSEKAVHIIRELHSEKVVGDNPVVLVADLETNPFENDNLVHFVRGRIDSDDVLKRARVDRARSAIVLNEDGEDATTVLACLTIRKLNPDIYIVAEVSKSENRSHFETARVNEIIVNSEINSRLLLRSALHCGIAQVIEELTTATHGNEIYKMEIKEKWVGQKFGEMYMQFYNNYDAILLGLIRSGEVITNPDREMVLKSRDELVYIANKPITV
ncbi:hypothetical protein BBF96_14925 [Anoxybacter fermentans]|uniref:RCK N-terminal domain-containing protein n=1 Tax=Anoxybacter fermentans TaxID=1323375 RepID=A0A3Q9HSH3_9FIRM|nr:ion channel [Anoxybacter fermentans]AZR74567.1 hypothetical protein BBF96_14925 [Anoxybacter fermentans]